MGESENEDEDEHHCHDDDDDDHDDDKYSANFSSGRGGSPRRPSWSSVANVVMLTRAR